jgi:hypothetical protein
MGRSRNSSGHGNAAGLRQMLVDRQRREFGPASRWYDADRWPTPHAQALEAGDDVLVESSDLLQVFTFEGLPADRYGYGGPDHGKTFLLSGDSLT